MFNLILLCVTRVTQCVLRYTMIYIYFLMRQFLFRSDVYNYTLSGVTTRSRVIYNIAVNFNAVTTLCNLAITFLST